MKNKKRLILPVAGIILLSPSLSFSQDARTPADRMMQMHHETMDDKYLPNAFNNKKTSPAYKYKSTGAQRSVSSSITTIQVNVDSSGRNIIGDAANEPNIAVNPLDENKIVIGWRQFDNVTSNFRQAGWAYTTNAGQSWTFAGRIDAGVFHSDPVLDFDKEGNFYYNSLANDFTCKVYESTNGGASWNNRTNADGGDKQWMTIDRTAGVGSGNIYAFWTYLYSTCMPGFFTRSTNEDTSFESCTIINSYPYFGTTAVGNAGELYIAGTDSNANIVFSESVNAQFRDSVVSWNVPQFVNIDGFINGSSMNPAGLLGQVNIDVDRSNGPGRGNIYVLASLNRISSNDPADVMFASSTDGGLTWSNPIQINDDSSIFNTQWFGTMSVAPNGRIDAIWLDNRDAVTGADSSALYYSYSVDQGNTWSINQKMSGLFDPHVGYPNQNKMGDYFDMISDNIGAHLAWANTFNGEEDVYYSRIIPNIPTAVNEIANNTTFTIYPNPTHGTFVIASPEIIGINSAKQSQIEIYNVLGEKVYAEKLSNSPSAVERGLLHSVRNDESEIDISYQPAGVYFLKISNEDGSSAVKKIIRE